MAASYRVLLLQAKDGEPLAELPLSSISATRVLTGTGTLTGTLPAGSEKAVRSLVSPGLGRELALIRNGTTCVWNGPLIQTIRTLEGDTQLTAADPGWYFSRRVTEGPRNYGRPVLSAVQDLVNMAQAQAGASLSKPATYAKLYRLSLNLDPDAGGPVKRWAIGGADRVPILQVIGDLADEDVAGFDWRWEWSYEPVGQLVSRVWHFGYPRLGVERGHVTVEPPHLLSLEDVESMERAANRVHVLGAGTGTGRKRATASNGTHAATAGVLYEQAVERTNTSNQTTLQGMANAFRRVLNPPGRIVTTTHRVSGGVSEGGIAWGAADVGDHVRVRYMAGTEQLDVIRRIVAETLTVTDDGEEAVAWTYNDPAEEVVS